MCDALAGRLAWSVCTTDALDDILLGVAQFDVVFEADYGEESDCEGPQEEEGSRDLGIVAERYEVGDDEVYEG
jgi:hypothetical protein